jgi:hypothetical protein
MNGRTSIMTTIEKKYILQIERISVDRISEKCFCISLEEDS